MNKIFDWFNENYNNIAQLIFWVIILGLLSLFFIAFFDFRILPVDEMVPYQSENWWVAAGAIFSAIASIVAIFSALTAKKIAKDEMVNRRDENTIILCKQSINEIVNEKNPYSTIGELHLIFLLIFDERFANNTMGISMVDGNREDDLKYAVIKIMDCLTLIDGKESTLFQALIFRLFAYSKPEDIDDKLMSYLHSEGINSHRIIYLINIIKSICNIEHKKLEINDVFLNEMNSSRNLIDKICQEVQISLLRKNIDLSVYTMSKVNKMLYLKSLGQFYYNDYRVLMMIINDERISFYTKRIIASHNEQILEFVSDGIQKKVIDDFIGVGTIELSKYH